MSEAAIICTFCIGLDPMHAEDDGWMGDCPWFLRCTKTPGHDPEGICDRGCYSEPECQTCCPGVEPDGWGPAPSPRGEPCTECNGLGVTSMIRNTRFSSGMVFL